MELGNIRQDGRTKDDMRVVTYRKQQNARVDGSVEFGYGEVQVLASTTGPVEVGLRDEIVDKATIEVGFRSLNGVVGVEYKTLSMQLQGILSSVVIAEHHPRSLIRFVVQTLSSPTTPCYLIKDAVGAPPFRIPVSEKAAATNGAVLAAVHSNIPLSGLVVAVSVAVVHDVLVIDPTSFEEADASSVHLVAFKFSSSVEAIVAVDSIGEFTTETDV
ncbi:hypothetical protein E3P99_02729 [Wallemia hederae]|uniref:Uncharacterized protein n=1 Tax=Wallemia hederae TaxID=1540922 RepID=A0A4V4LSY2_9BASI|nr:hypothetical protein E3P99_02729 [Wallemia hederae]